MQSQHDGKDRELPLVIKGPLIVGFVVLLLPLIPLLLASYLLYAILLQLVIWICWCRRGIHVLLVYSDSPNWHEHIECRLIPQLPASTVVLNWSERRNWKRFSLAVMAFRFFGGTREFNPLVIVFQPFRWAKVFRFWKPFHDYKHGKTAALEKLEDGLFQHLTRSGIQTAR